MKYLTSFHFFTDKVADNMWQYVIRNPGDPFLATKCIPGRFRWAQIFEFSVRNGPIRSGPAVGRWDSWRFLAALLRRPASLGASDKKSEETTNNIGVFVTVSLERCLHCCELVTTTLALTRSGVAETIWWKVLPECQKPPYGLHMYEFVSTQEPYFIFWIPNQHL